MQPNNSMFEMPKNSLAASFGPSHCRSSLVLEIAAGLPKVMKGSSEGIEKSCSYIRLPRLRIKVKGLRSGTEHAQKQAIWLHILRWHTGWRKMRFTGATAMLRFLEATKWDFVGAVSVLEKKSDHRAL